MEPTVASYFARMNRRQMFGRCATGLGVAALASLLGNEASGADKKPLGQPALAGLPHHAPKAERVIYLWQGGGPSHLDLFDPKPTLEKNYLKDLPESVRGTTRLSTMTAGYAKWPAVPAIKPFKKWGKSGLEISTLLPFTGEIADELCLVRSMNTEAVNHAPGVTFFLTGSQVPGRPSLGAWVTYGLGSEAADLPAFVVMTSSDKGRTCGQLFYDYYWGSGFLPSKFQGTRFRATGDPVPYLNNPQGVSSTARRKLLDGLQELNAQHLADVGDPETETRIAQYEMAFKMQTSVPGLLDFKDEPKHVLDMYGPQVNEPGTFARHCLIARRLVERGTRFVQLMHSGWDQHGNLYTQLEGQCKDTDQPSAALVKDLKRLGLLDKTLVVWGGEFGRTPFGQGPPEKPNGRDHFGRAFSLWMAGGGVKAGHVHGETDDWAWNIAKDPVHVHDHQATILHLLGIDHTRLTFRYQGRQFRLTDVHGAVVRGVLA
ncbi:MAG TPA: DUF1501 domain-containing protein [Gemmataceae bacterium]|jgi:hypothetical protein|nr:DUF1501 domain-containing protein [Gemmataceae bacterium]